MMRLILNVTCTLALLFLAGCSVPISVNNAAAAATAGSSGIAVGGQQPVANATVQLYSVGTTGDDSTAAPLLTKTVTTDASGNFNIAGLYSCAGATEVYLTVTGGNPEPGVTNTNLAMMTALGPCSSLNAMTFIVVNELTTVAAVNALAPYMTSYTMVGSGSGDVTSLDAAFTLASEMVNPATGTSPGLNVPDNETVPTEAIDTLGNVAAACINSGGGIAGDGTACGTFFSLTKPTGAAPPTNTIAALLYLAKNPELNTSALYQLIAPNAPFQPQLPGLPPNFDIAITPSTTAAPLVLAPTSINFPSTALGGTSQAQSATLMNPGTAAALVSGIALTGANAASFVETNDCPATLAGGGFCTIQMAFSPQSSAAQNATLQVNAGHLSIALSGTGNTPAWPSMLLAASPSLYLNFNDDTTSFLDQVSGLSFSVGGSTVAPRQPGFDNTAPDNTSAAFAWSAYNKAPNNTLGAIEWNVPWSMLVHIDRLNWNRTGTLVLASKGDLASSTWWMLTLGMSGTFSQLCFTRRSTVTWMGAQDGLCTSPYYDAMPNGFNYDIMVEDDGTGAVGMSGSGATSAISMYINGLNGQYIPESPIDNTYSNGFGYVNLSVTGGTGYADTTSFTSTGGGPNCVVAGFMYASGGVPYNGNWTPTNSPNYGCTSVPTIVLTSPTGTGAVITATLSGTSMNSTKYPLMVPGYVSGGSYYGVAGTNAAAPPINIDEFAIFPGNLSVAQVSKIFSQTKFYQGLVYPNTTSDKGAPVVIADMFGCGGDPSSAYQLAITIAAHKEGLINLEGVVDSDGTPSPNGSVAWYRQMLDSAGLSNIPLTVGPGSPDFNDNSNCPASNIAIYNASTPQSPTSYSSSTPMYRQIFAENPTVPIYVNIGGGLNGYAAFLESQADNISPLTGLQLNAQNAANGGYINIQGGDCGTNPAITPCNAPNTSSNVLLTPAPAQFLLANNGATPVYFNEGTPASSGPGSLDTRTINDPFYLAMLAQYEGSGETSRPGWQTQQLAQVISPYFWGGVQVTYRGGVGYADATPFASTGGGPYCNVQGILTAKGGVPNGIETSWGETLPSSWEGLGYGCTSAPTLVLTNPTGTGVTLTAYPTQFCMSVSVGQSGGVWTENSTTAKCSNQYTEMPSQYAVPPGNSTTAPIFQWFQNSLIDPTP